VGTAEELRALGSELKLAGAAAVAMALTLGLPWYQKSFVPPGATAFQSTSVTGLGAFSFVEAAVLLVAAGVVYLVWARVKRRGFHLPGGDGVVISVAGAWALLLIVYRMFDKPDVEGAVATVGIRPGIFVAAAAAGALIAAGAQVRAAGRPEPPNPAAEMEWEGPPIPSRRRREPGASSSDARLGERPPAQEGEPPAAPPERRA